MDFPGNLTDRVSHLFDNDMDEILVFVMLFIFIILTDHSDDKLKDGQAKIGFPVILIAGFLVLFLITGNTRESGE